MNTIRLIIVVLLSVLAFSPRRAHAQTDEIAQLLLNVEKLAQFKQILDDMKKGYEILSGGYNTVKNLTQGNFSIHQVFLDGLLKVNPEIANYRKVAGIIQSQLRILQEYRSALSRFKSTGVFRPEELDYLEGVYGNLLRKSLQNLDELTMVITSGQLRMSDDERLTAIDRIHAEMEEKLEFVRDFNGDASLLAIQRVREQNSIGTVGALYGK